MKAAANDNDKILIYNARTGEAEEVDRVVNTDAEWKKILSPEAYRVTRRQGTERPFTAMCELPGKSGLYECVGCGTDLFAVGTKFESASGWPSFWQPVSDLNIKEETDNSLGMRRTEVLCARCGAHLGHVFDDGPPPTGKRYCINSAALKFVDTEYKPLKKATFAAGCFWGVEEAFRTLKGVVSTKAGYTGGTLKNPAYKDVCSGRTGHAEAVEIEYNPEVISYEELLDVFWSIHDPTTLDRQGPDVGSQYRSAIFYHDEEQEKAAKASLKKLEESREYPRRVVTEIVPAGEFYTAEEYHQQYVKKGGRAGCAR